MQQRMGWTVTLAALCWSTGATAVRAQSVGMSASASVGQDGDTTDIDTGGEFGYSRVDQINWLAPTLAADVRLHHFQASARVPLRLDPQTGDLRDADWDERGDYFRLTQCVRIDYSDADTFQRERGQCLPWQVPRDDYYFSARFGPVFDFTLGHGTVLNAYSNNLNPDHFQAGVVGEFQFHQFVRGNYLIDDVLAPNLVGATVSIQPFGYELEESAEWYEEGHHARIDATVVSDLRAPQTVRTAFGQALTDDKKNLLYSTDAITVFGADLNYRYNFGSQLEFEARADWNAITGHGMGGHGQLRLIYNHPDGLYSVRWMAEGRYTEPNYIPNYFDSQYFIQRQQFALVDNVRDLFAGSDNPFLTKQEFLQSLDDADAWIAGYYAGASFDLYTGTGDDRRRLLESRFYISDSFDRDNDGQFLVSLSLLRLNGKIDVHAMYSRQNWDALEDIFKLDNSLARVLVRWDLSDQFYLLMNYGRVWQLQTNVDATSSIGFESNNEALFSVGFAESVQ